MVMSEKRAKLDVHYQLIDTDELFAKALNELSNKSFIGIDVESNPQRVRALDLSLLQIGDEHVQFLFDPLAIDITKLNPLFENESITKIFFSGNQDVQIIKYHLHCKIIPYFDLQTAYLWVSEKHTGLAGLIRDFFDVTISKEEQTAKWHLRPLTQSMLQYAATDVLYLPTLYDVITPLLVDKDLFGKIQLLFASYSLKKPIKREVIERTQFLTIEGFNRLTNENKFITKRLFDNRLFFLSHFSIENIIHIVSYNQQEQTEFLNNANFSRKEVKNILFIIDKSRTDFEKPNMYFNEISKFELLGQNNYDLLNADLTPRFAISIEEFVDNYKRLKSWTKRKKEQLNIQNEAIIPNLFLRELATFDFPTIETKMLFSQVVDQLPAELQTELKFVIQKKEIAFFDELKQFVSENKLPYPETFIGFNAYRTDYNHYDTFTISKEKGSKYYIIADLYTDVTTIEFVLSKKYFNYFSFLCEIYRGIFEHKYYFKEKNTVIVIGKTMSGHSYATICQEIDLLVNLTDNYRFFKLLD